MSNRILLLLWGESFRFAPQMTRGSCINESKIRQNIASLSHNKFIKNLKKKGYETDLFINVHKLPNDYKNYLLYLYSTCNIIQSDFNENINLEIQMLNDCYNKFNLINNTYDYFIMIRIDLYLKKYFLENIKISNENIIFGHIDIAVPEVQNISICQQIMCFPKKMYYVIQNKIIYNATHKILNKLKENNIQNYDFIVYSLHICSTDLGWNPLYIQIGRNYNKEFFLITNRDNYYDIKNNNFLKVNHETLYTKQQINEDDECNVKIKYFKSYETYKTLFHSDENKRIINVYKFNNTNFSGKNLYYPNVLLISDNEHYLPVIEKTMSLNQSTLYEKNNMETNIKIPQGIGGVGKGIQINQIYKMTTTLEGNYFFFIYNTDNYFHFLYDSLPYLISYFELKKDIPGLKLLMQYPNPQKNNHYLFVVEMLELIGINDTDIEILNSKCQYENVFVSTSYTHDFDSNLPPRKEIYDFYQSISRKVLNIYKNPTPKKIYISRRTHLHNDFSNIGTNYTQRRKLVNEDELVDKLTKEGYIELFTEKLSTIEKIANFANATHVVGCIGGGIANVLFSPPETKLTAIISPTFLDVNTRFKYSLDCVDVFYDFNTEHIEKTEFKKYMRIKTKNNSIIGEIIEVKEYSVIVQYTDGSNTGWNNNNTFKQIEIKIDQIEKIDNGLNSCFKLML